MKRKRTISGVAIMLLSAFFTMGANASNAIDLTFSAAGEAKTVESVTVTNLTHTDIAPLTLKGTAPCG